MLHSKVKSVIVDWYSTIFQSGGGGANSELKIKFAKEFGWFASIAEVAKDNIFRGDNAIKAVESADLHEFLYYLEYKELNNKIQMEKQ